MDTSYLVVSGSTATLLGATIRPLRHREKLSMSRTSWRSAEALQIRRRDRRAVQQADDRARHRREREEEKWHATGEPAFQPTERSYPAGGGVDGVAEFLASAERAVHLYDRGGLLSNEMAATAKTLQRRHVELIGACAAFGDKHASHEHPERVKHWEVGTQELRLYVQAAARMTPSQREKFSNVLAPLKDKKSVEPIGPLEPLATRLMRAKNSSVEQAVSGVIFSSGSSPAARRFARGVKVFHRHDHAALAAGT